MVALPQLAAEEQSELFIEEVPIAVEDLQVPEEPAPASEPSRPAPVRVSRLSSVAAQPEETPIPPASVHVPLESLLRTPLDPPKKTLDLRTLRDKPVAAAAPTTPGALDLWKDRVHVERHTEATGPSGPRQGKVSQTDAGLRVPVDDSVSLEGGVRVDQREEPGIEKPERKSIPRVGVEVKF